MKDAPEKDRGNAAIRKRTSENGTTYDTGVQKPSNEYVLNVAFFSFLIFLTVQFFFAVVAHSQSMISDSLAMSVDAFTYLFNLIAERLKRNPNACCCCGGGGGAKHHKTPLTMEERRHRRKLTRLYLEFFPPLISVTALTIVSYRGLRESVNSILELTRSPILGATYISSAAKEEDPNVQLMLIFSGLNLLLDMLNVTCFAKTDNFSIASLEQFGLQFDQTKEGGGETKKVMSNGHGHGYQDIDRVGENGHNDIELGNGMEEKEDFEEEPLKKVYPVSTINSSESSSGRLDNSDDDITYNESDKLLGISRPEYTSPEKEWDEDLSIGAKYGGEDSIRSEDSYGRNTYFSFVSTGVSPAKDDEDSFREKTLSPSNNSTKLIEWGDDLEGISEGEEEENGEDDDLISEDDSLSEVNNGLFNLNMCSAYTHVMADTLRSVAVFVAAGCAYAFSLDPAIADATASIVVSIIIAISLGPLLLGLVKTIAEIRSMFQGQSIIDDFNEKIICRE